MLFATNFDKKSDLSHLYINNNFFSQEKNITNIFWRIISSLDFFYIRLKSIIYYILFVFIVQKKSYT